MIALPKRTFAIILNPFITLGLDEFTTLDEAKAKYKQLVLKYHPDVNPSVQTSEKFREITEAYGMIKKRIATRESIGIPPEAGFSSKRPKYNGTVGSVHREDKIREYINFRPLDIQIPNKDRLGIEYRPFFTDQDSVHPKTGTFGMMLACVGLVFLYSSWFMSLAERDEKVNQILYEKLLKKTNDNDWDGETIHPALQAAQADPLYEEYLEAVKRKKAIDRFKSFIAAPALIEKFNPDLFEMTERSREFARRFD